MSTSTPPATEPTDDGSTTRTATGGERSPRLPHEHDESADAGGDAERPIVEKAADDVAAGRTNTDRGEATDAVYEGLRRG